MHSAARVALAGLFYLGITILCVGRPAGLDHALLGIGNDPKSSVWFLAWWPWAIAHGRDPFWSHAVFAPGGYSMAWGTSVATASLLALPVTLSAGPVVAFNVLTLAAPALSGAALFALAMAITANRAASLLAGFLFAFSGYENGQLLGHLNLDLTFLLPVIVLLVYRRLQYGIGRNRFVGLLALALAAQFGLSSELFATIVACGVVALLVAALSGAGATRVRRATLIECAAALALATVLITPMLVSMWRGAGDMPDFVNSPVTYSDDLLNLVIPTDAERLAPPVARALSDRFTGNASEQDLYLGIPLLLIVLLFAVERGKMRGRMLVTASFVGFVAASLGPQLQAGGVLTPVPLPWAIVTHLPLLRGALPCRMGLFVALVASLAAAIWMAGPAHRIGRGWRLALGCLACVFLVPGAASRAWSRIDRPCLFDAVQQGRALRHETALLLPFGSGDTMLWQAQSGLRFSQVGGLLSFVPNSLERDPLVLPLLRNESEPGFGPDFARFAREHDVSVVVAGPGTSAALVRALGTTGWPSEQMCRDVVTFRRPGQSPLEPTLK